MKRFVLSAKAEFMAEDIDDAMWKLGLRFLAISAGREDNLIELGSIEVGPMTDEKSC